MSPVANKKILGIDVNGPVLDPVIKALAIKATTGIHIPPHLFGTKWQVIEQFGLTNWKYGQSMKYGFENKSFFLENYKLTPGIESFILRMKRAGFEIRLISSCRGLRPERMAEVIRRHDLPVTYIQVGDSKFDAYSQCSVVIDNELANLTPIVDVPGIIPILMLPAVGGTGSAIIKPPKDIDPRIRVGYGLTGIEPYVQQGMAKAA